MARKGDCLHWTTSAGDKRLEKYKLFSLQTSYFIYFSASLKNYCGASLMNSVSIPVCKVFHDLVQCHKAPVDGEVTCSNFQMMVYIMEGDLSNFRFQRLKKRDIAD